MVKVKDKEKTTKDNVYLLRDLDDFHTFPICGLKELIKKQHVADNIQDVYFSNIDETQSLKDYLVSKLDTVGASKDYEIPATIRYSNMKKDITLKIEALEVLTLLNPREIKDLCYTFLNMENNDSQRIEIHIKQNAEGRGAIIISARDGGWELPKLVNQLGYIFEKLGIPVTQDRDRFRIKIHPVAMAHLAPQCYWSGVVYDQLQKQSPDQSKEHEGLIKIQKLCANYLGHTYRVTKEVFPFSRSLLNEKEQAIKKLYYANTLKEAKEILKDNHSLLLKSRTPALVALLETIALILTCPLSVPIFLAKRGSLNFYKSPHSQLLAEQAQAEIIQAMGSSKGS